MALSVRACAKVNLVLRVGPLRADGFHDLATLMTPVNLADDVLVRAWPGRRGAVTCHTPGRPDLDGASNLAARAAEAFRSRFGVRDRVAITVKKRVPVVAGLGGGSSDAAATLRALARAYGVRDRAALAAAGLEVGSDVPFFLGSGPAWARGRGERLEPAHVAPLHLVILYPRHPSNAIRAGEAYRWLDASRQQSGGRATLRAGGLHPPFRPDAVTNDLQGPCFERHPLLKTLARHLVSAGAASAIMSGSGPSVFGIFTERAGSLRARARLTEVFGADIEVHAVRTLQRHPGVTPWKSPRSASSP
ncbi:MAG TPA: 4-(cytidine 5'-diphospho)-2-C-methyl-D-erythritol kinase [Anaeromyxobacteraceae bacterium]|nr:4-(cytidine 5'-diphospho)-2-C-methyl-D-erythritol kinase [Anaeromyxobacteraceae bacterium]